MMMCKKCSVMGGVLLLVLGLLFLLVDLGVWDFWNISWWSALFLLMGLVHIGKSSCGMCCSMDKSDMSMKKRGR